MRNLAEASLAFIFAVLKPLRRREDGDGGDDGDDDSDNVVVR